MTIASEPGSRVNLGCGLDARAGWVNVDTLPGPSVDVVQDATEYLRSLPDRSVREILALDLLEHLADPLALMREAARVLRPEGTITVRVPHRLSKNAWLDWSHRHDNWCREKMEWLASPSPWVGFRLALVRYREERAWRIRERPWWRPRRYGNIHAVYSWPRQS